MVWLVTVKVVTEERKGEGDDMVVKTKKKNVTLVVEDAISATDAEAQVTEYMQGDTRSWELVGATLKENIEGVIRKKEAPVRAFGSASAA